MTKRTDMTHDFSVEIPLVGQRSAPTLGEADPYPMDDYLLAFRNVDGNITKGGILIPETAQEAVMPTYTIWRVGPGRTLTNGTRLSMPYKCGDVIMCDGTKGTIQPIEPNKDDSIWLLEERVIVLRLADPDRRLRPSPAVQAILAKGLVS